MKLLNPSILITLLFWLISLNALASESLSYSGRLVNPNGSPVAGPVNLKVELAYTNAPNVILCSQDFTSVILSNGVFHLKLDLDCGAPVTLSQVLNQIPANESAAIRVTDVTHSKTYSFQALHSMPFANIAETSRQLVQMGATDGQVLKWNNATSKWIPGTPGGGGTVTNVSVSAPLSVSNGGTTPAISLSKATAATDGYLSSADWTNFNNKVGVVSGGTTAQYYRGDNSWQTLNTSVVPESGAINLYFSNARVLGVPLDGFVAGPGVIAATDTVLEAFGKIQGQINTINTDSANYLVKNGTDTITGTVTVASPTGFLRLIDPPALFTDATNMAYVDSRDDLKVSKSGDTMSGLLTLDGDLKLKGGANYVTLKAHASTSANFNFVLPQSTGTNGFVLVTDGNGNTSWVDSAVNSGSIINDSIVDADINASAGIAQSKIANLTTDLAGKEPTLANPNDTTKYYRGDKSWQTLNTNAVAEGTNLYFTNARVLGVDLTGLNTGVAGPIVATDTVLDAFGKLQNQITTANSKGQWEKNVNDIYYNAGQVGIGTNNPGSALEVKGTLRLAGSTSGYVGLAPAAVAGSTTYTLPAADGSAGQLLKTNGAGVLSWVNDNTGAGAFSGASNKAVITDGVGALGTSATTATELGYVSGVTSSIQMQLNAKQTTTLAAGNILVGNGSNVATAVTPSSDVSMTNAGAFTVTKLQGSAVATTAPGVGSILKWDNVLSQWTPIPFATCTGATEVMHYNVVTDTWSCDALSVTNLLPSQATHAGKVLKTDGTTASWQTVSATPAGANGQVQFNNSGSLGASANFFWDSVNSYLGIGASTPQAPLHVAGSAIFGNATSSYTGTSTMVIKNTKGIVFESPTAVMTNMNVNGDIWSVDRCTNASCSSASPAIKLGLAGAGYLELPNGPHLRLGTTTNLGTAGISIGTAWGDAVVGVQDANGPTNLTIKASGTTGTLANISGGTLNLSAGASSGTGSSKIDFKTATPGATGTTLNSPTTKMTITGAGYVGIGTTNPQNQIHLVNANNALIRLDSGAGLASGIYHYNGATAGSGIALFPAADSRILSIVGSDLINNNAKLTVLQNGNVGIGSTTPDIKLDVAGAVRVGTDATACSATIAGAIRYNAGNVEYCNGTTWAAFSSGASGISSLNGLNGTTQTFATPGTTGTAPNWSSAGSAHTINIPMAATAGVTAGLISKTDYDAFNSKLGSTLNSGNIWVGNGSNVATAVAPSSDVSMTNAGAFTVTKLQGNSVSTTAPVLGSFLKWDNILSQWAPTALATCSGTNQVMHYILLTDTWSCDTLNIDNLLPTQTANSGKVLTTNGTTASWQTPAGVTGSGTTNYLPKFTAASTLGDSLIYDNGTKVGVGTNAPVNTLSVLAPYGNASNSGSASNGGFRLMNTTDAVVLDMGIGINTTAWLQARDPANYATKKNLLLNPLGGHVTVGGRSEFVSLSTNTTNAANGVMGIIGTDITSASSYGIMVLANNRTTPAAGDTAGEIRLSMNNNAGWRDMASITTKAEGTGGANGFGGNLILSTKADNINVAPYERMRITSNGNVGINTSTPEGKLVVNGGAGGNYAQSSAASYYPFNSGVPGNAFVEIINNANGYGSPGSFLGLKTTAMSGTPDQRAYIGIHANMGAANYTPSIVIGHQTGATSYQERMRIDSSGNVGIGTITPGTGTKLSVDGQIRSKSFTTASGAIDWSNGNSGTTSFNCGSNITFANLRDGGSYTLVVTDTAATTCNFSTTTTGDDAATVSYRFLPANASRTASSHSVYSLQRIGTIVYVSWLTGF